MKDSVVVITGAASGVGRATAYAFADAGAVLVLAGRRDEALRELARECRERGTLAEAVPTDVGDETAVRELARRAVDRYGRVDVWVNNAGVAVYGDFLGTPSEDVRRALEVNLLGYLHGARAALPYLREQGGGVVVNVASLVGVVPQPYAAAYAVSKAAVRAFAVSLRQELRLRGPRKVAVCTVLPAALDTPLFRNAANYSGRQVRPIPPVCDPRRVARAIVNAVRVPRREIVVGATGRLLVLAHRLAPGLTERAFARWVDRYQFAGDHAVPPVGGNLFRPSDPADAVVDGDWRRPAGFDLRRRLAGGLAATVAVLAAAAVTSRRRRVAARPGAGARRHRRRAAAWTDRAR